MSENPPLSRLVRPASRLPTPKDYFRGLTAPDVVHADNILMFFRESYSELQQRALENRSHHRFVLLMPLTAAAGVGLDRSEHTLHPGEALLVFPYQFHFFVRPEAERLDWLVLTFESDNPESLAPLRNRPVRLEADALRRLESLLKAYGERREGGEAGILLTARILLQKLTRAPGSEVRPAAAAAPRESRNASEWLSHINRRLHDGGPGGHRIEAFAKELGVSERLLRQRFQENFGISLGAYIHDFQLNRAAGLLTQTAMPLGEIAGRCGYASQAAFSRAFRAQTGSTPRDYRVERRPAGLSPAAGAFANRA